jgi:hypothetical protein
VSLVKLGWSATRPGAGAGGVRSGGVARRRQGGCDVEAGGLPHRNGGTDAQSRRGHRLRRRGLQIGQQHGALERDAAGERGREVLVVAAPTLLAGQFGDGTGIVRPAVGNGVVLTGVADDRRRPSRSRRDR